MSGAYRPGRRAFVAVREGRLVKHDITQRPFGEQDLGFVALHPRVPEKGVIRFTVDVCQILRKYLEDGLADDLISGEPDIRLKRRVAAEIDAFGILIEDRRRNGVDQGLQQMQLLQLGFFDFFAIADFGKLPRTP